MFKRVLFVALIVVVVLGAVGFAAAQERTPRAACGFEPGFQVRFIDFEDIPLFGSKADAIAANEIFISGSTDSIPRPVVRVPGGQRQKYLLCQETVTQGEGGIAVFQGGNRLWAAEVLIESIVTREKTDAFRG
jgi:hypothetical protein